MIRFGYWIGIAGFLSAALGADGVRGTEMTKQPWRLAAALNLPSWLDVAGTHRMRYETLDGQFRAGRPGGDQMLAFRTTLKAELRLEPVSIVGEGIDSRQALADGGSPINATMVDTLDLLQAFGAVRFGDPLHGRSEVRVGRQTIDVESRRLVARNRFRNTINTFTGAHWESRFDGGQAVQAFYVLPVNRLPADAASLLGNETEFDEESLELQFWGVHGRWPRLVWGGTGELYLFGVREGDASNRPVRDRQWYTPGLRFFRSPEEGGWDWDFEFAYQVGTERRTTAAAGNAVDHFAWFQHAEGGYTFAAEWSFRAAVIYDYASGDDDPADDENNRFDTLFGARRFEHGPTGIYGAFARSNISSPGVFVSLQPWANVEAGIANRWYWLASSRDAWTTSGLRDPSGNSGSFVGDQIEVQWRWDLVPGNVRIEAGGAHLFAGEFVKDASTAEEKGDSSYAYVSFDLRF